MSKHNYSNYSKPNKPRAEESEILGVDLSPADDVCVEVPLTEPEPIINKHLTGKVSGCSRLNVREEPDFEAEVLTIIEAGTEVEIEKDVLQNPILVNGFYKVCLASGLTGYCLGKYLKVNF